MSAIFFAFDVETTGLNPEVDEIIQLAYQVLDKDMNVLQSDVYYVWPKNTNVSDAAAKVNGYSSVKWSANRAMSQTDLYYTLQNVLGNYKRLVPLGHNVKFDLDFLKALFIRYQDDKTLKDALSYHSFDTVGVSMFFDYAVYGRFNGGYKLTDLTARFELDHGAAHTADSDIAATVLLFKKLTDLLKPENASKLAAANPPKQWNRFFGKNPDGSWMINMGKHKGKTLDALASSEPDYLMWMVGNLENLADEQRSILQQHISASMARAG